jgi:hypothetical protein
MREQKQKARRAKIPKLAQLMRFSPRSTSPAPTNLGYFRERLPSESLQLNDPLPIALYVDDFWVVTRVTMSSTFAPPTPQVERRVAERRKNSMPSPPAPGTSGTALKTGSSSPLLIAMFAFLVVFPWLAQLLPQQFRDYIAILFR